MNQFKLFDLPYDHLKFRCTNMDNDPYFNFGCNPCATSIKYGNIWLCGDPYGRYCPDYCSERCGAAVRREF